MMGMGNLFFIYIGNVKMPGAGEVHQDAGILEQLVSLCEIPEPWTRWAFGVIQQDSYIHTDSPSYN